MSFVSCSTKQSFQTTFFGAFDTVSTINGYFETREDFDKTALLIEKQVKYYNKLFDIYNSYDNINNIKTINDNAGKKVVKVSNDLFQFLQYCKKVYKITNGNVNVCFGSVLKIWHDYREEGKKVPSYRLLKAADKYTDIDNLVLDKNKITAYLKSEKCSLDVGAIAKGYTCKIVKSYAKKVGFTSGIINLGGNVCVVGKKNNNDFEIGIEDPNNTNNYVSSVLISNKSVVTSGDYQRYYTVNSVKYCHIIDTISLFPAKANKSVSIISKDSALADSLSTALFIMNYKDGIKLIESIDDCEAFIIDSNNKYYYSSGFKEYIKS